MVALAFIFLSLAWSLSWYAMRLQVDSFIPPELSVFYRFFLATILMFILCFITKQRMKLTKNEIFYLTIIGFCNFFANFAIGYSAAKYVASGVIAVIFSLCIITSEFFSAYFDNRKIEKKVIISSLIGFAGLIFFVFPLMSFSSQNKAVIGCLMSVVMMFIYSFGGSLVSRNKKLNHTPLYTTISYGMLFGTIFSFAFNLMRGNEFTFDFSPSYVLSLAYLTLIAATLAFICLFYLIEKIGSARANYTALIYPTIALVISSFLEDFQFNSLSVFGLILIISALVIEFMPKTFIKNKLRNFFGINFN